MAEVVIFPAAIREFFDGPQGPIAQDTARRCLRVVAVARPLCPVHSSRLRSSIRFALHVDAQGLYGLAGSDVEYAAAVHNGSRPHMPPVAALTVWASRHGFASPWPVALKIAAKGTKPHPFLLDALPAALG
jgi:hypothetical protein